MENIKEDKKNNDLLKNKTRKNQKTTLKRFLRYQGLKALNDGKCELAKKYFSLDYQHTKEKTSLCLILICDILPLSPNFSKLLLKDLAINHSKQPDEYLDNLIDFLMQYKPFKIEINELEYLNYNDFMAMIKKSDDKKNVIINMINSSRIIINSKQELTELLEHLISVKLYDVAMIYCEQIYPHFKGDEYFCSIVNKIQKSLKDANKNK